MSKNQKEKEDQLPTFLQEMRGQNPFQVPPTYFKNLGEETWQRANPTRDRKGIRILPQGISSAFKVVIRRLRPSLILGAIALLIGLAVLWPSSSEDAESAMALTETEILEYLEANVDDFELSELYDANALTMEGVSIDMLGDPSQQLDLDPFYEELVEDLDLEDIL